MALNKIFHGCGYPPQVQSLVEADGGSTGKGSSALHLGVSSAHGKLGCKARLGLKPGIRAATRARAAQVQQVLGLGTGAD